MQVSVHLNFNGDCRQAMERYCEFMPIQETLRAKRFGVVIDRFGIPWEVNCSREE